MVSNTTLNLSERGRERDQKERVNERKERGRQEEREHFDAK